MLAIDPGTSIVNTGISTLLKVGTSTITHIHHMHMNHTIHNFLQKQVMHRYNIYRRCDQLATTSKALRQGEAGGPIRSNFLIFDHRFWIYVSQSIPMAEADR